MMKLVFMPLRFVFFMSILLVFVVLTAACGGQAGENSTPTSIPTVRPLATIEPTATEEAESTVEVTEIANQSTPTDTDTKDTFTVVINTPTLIPSATFTPSPEPTIPTATPEPPTATPTPTIPAETVIEVSGVKLPPGFSLIKYADINAPTSLMFANDGTLFATSLNGGEIMAFRDENGDGRAEFSNQFSYGFDQPVGIAQHPETGDFYVSSTSKISILRDDDGDFVAEDVSNFVDGLPHAQHKNNNLKFGPDGWLYMGVGSTCDVCYEQDPRSATVMRFNIETGAEEVYATGLRNPYDIAFNRKGELFATDNGRDDLGIDDPFEELNHIVLRGDYGFPDCWNESDQDGCGRKKKAVAFFEARSSTNSITFYDGDSFPAEYDDILFAGVFGSWVNSNINRGIWQVSLTPSGRTYTGNAQWFAEWPNGWILGMTIGPDGALYVGDYQNGGIYRISYGL